MRLHLQRDTESNQLSAYGQGYFVVNDRRINSSIVIGPRHLDPHWSITSVSQLQEEDLLGVFELRPKVAILGSGARHEFPGTPVMAAFEQTGIGLEVMSTGAACRTYNVLLSEGRDVVAMLVLI